jgi:Tfp pilus assembly protein PilZ
MYNVSLATNSILDAFIPTQMLQCRSTTEFQRNGSGQKSRRAKLKRGDADVDVDLVSRSGWNTEASFYAGLSDSEPVGVFVPTYQPRPVGSLLMVSIDVPGCREPIVVPAIVRWHREASDWSDARPGIGVEFVSLSPKARELVRRYSQEHPPLLHEVS